MKFCKDCKHFLGSVKNPFGFQDIYFNKCTHPDAEEMRNMVNGNWPLAEDVRANGCGIKADWFEAREVDE